MDPVTRLLLLQHMMLNRLPWRVERDWTYEVTAVNGVIIAKCQTHAEATNIIKLADEPARELKESGELIDSIINAG